MCPLLFAVFWLPLTSALPGEVTCWGYNGDQQTNVPTGLSGVTAVYAGFDHSCALSSSGTVTCWGQDHDGETKVPANLASMKAVSADDDRSCGLTQSGEVICWGRAADVPANLGRVANMDVGFWHTCVAFEDGSASCWGARQGATDFPAGLDGVKAISSGLEYGCALFHAGNFTCWGKDNLGQTSPPPGMWCEAISAGSYHGLCLTAAATLEGWGWDAYGQASPPAGLADVRSFSAGNTHSCAVTASGAVSCWGRNQHGETDVPSGLVAQGVTAGGMFTCAWTAAGETTCWGLNQAGIVEAPAFSDAVGVAVGYGHSCAVTSAGRVQCWGDNAWGQIEAPAGNFKAVTAGYYHSCVLTVDKSVRCFGRTNWGLMDVPSSLGNQVIQIKAGVNFVCALTEAFKVSCWGHNNFGQLDVPSDLPLLTSITTGTYMVCGLTFAKQHVCWGRDSLSYQSAPSDLPPLRSLHLASSSMACGITEDLALLCWWAGAYVTAAPSDLGRVAVFAAWSAHECAVTVEGIVRCWGLDHNGQASPPSGLEGVVALEVSTRHSCAVMGFVTSTSSSSTTRSTSTTLGTSLTTSSSPSASTTGTSWTSTSTDAVTTPGMSTSTSSSLITMRTSQVMTTTALPSPSTMAVWSSSPASASSDSATTSSASASPTSASISTLTNDAPSSSASAPTIGASISTLPSISTLSNSASTSDASAPTISASISTLTDGASTSSAAAPTIGASMSALTSTAQTNAIDKWSMSRPSSSTFASAAETSTSMPAISGTTVTTSLITPSTFSSSSTAGTRPANILAPTGIPGVVDELVIWGARQFQGTNLTILRKTIDSGEMLALRLDSSSLEDLVIDELDVALRVPASALKLLAGKPSAFVMTLLDEGNVDALDSSTTVLGKALALDFVSLEGEVLSVSDLAEPITFTLPWNYTQGVGCAYWDDAAWSSEGVSSGSSVDGRVLCSTRHLTLFASIWQGFVLTIACSQISLFSKEALQAVAEGDWYSHTGARVFWALLAALAVLMLTAAWLDWRRKAWFTWRREFFLVPLHDSPQEEETPASGARQLGGCGCRENTCKNMLDEVVSEWFEFFADVRNLCETVWQGMEMDLQCRCIAGMSRKITTRLVTTNCKRLVGASAGVSIAVVAFLLEDKDFTEYLNSRRQAAAADSVPEEPALVDGSAAAVKVEAKFDAVASFRASGRYFKERSAAYVSRFASSASNVVATPSNFSGRQSMGWTRALSRDAAWLGLHEEVSQHLPTQVSRHTWRAVPTMVLQHFWQANPLISTLHVDIFRSCKLRVMMLIVEISSTLMVTSFFFSATSPVGGRKKRKSSDCYNTSLQAQATFKLGRALAVAFGAIVLSWIPTTLLDSLYTVGFQKVPFEGSREWRRELRTWRLQERLIFVLGGLYSLFCLSFTAVFLANVDDLVHSNFGISCLLSSLQDAVIIPLSLSVCLPMAARLLLSCTSRHGQSRVGLIEEVYDSLFATTNLTPGVFDI